LINIPIIPAHPCPGSFNHTIDVHNFQKPLFAPTPSGAVRYTNLLQPAAQIDDRWLGFDDEKIPRSRSRACHVAYRYKLS
jgi:hypothetical protein